MKRTTLIIILLLAALVGTSAVKPARKAVPETDPDLLTRSIDIYCNVLKQLEIGYVDTLDHRKMLESALGHMLATLDPYTQFIPSDDDEFLKRMSSGKYGGVGSVITLMDSLPYFSEPYEGQPAALAGIRAGDQILEIDGVKTAGKPIADVSQMLRGTPGTPIRVRVKRAGEARPLQFYFVRKAVQMPTISYSCVIAPGVGYIRIEDFIDRTSADFREALATLVEQHQITSLVIDLRGNGGGLVDQAVDVAELFVPRGTKLVEMRGRNPREAARSYSTVRSPLYPKLRLAFVVDENTASASEILAGALQDLDRAIVLGEQSFGKGLVQQVRELPEDNYLKLTVAKYYLPSGRCVQRVDTSLTETFRTRHGRPVESGSGITPDSLLVDTVTVNISDYLYVNNMYFRFVNTIVPEMPAIAPVDSFVISDELYDRFCRFVLDRNFTYTLQSEKYVNNLRSMVEQEGYAAISDSAFAMMRAALKPNVERDLRLFRHDISEALAVEIVKRYYYQRGAAAQYLKTDAWAHTAARVVADEKEYNKLLK